MRLKIKDSVHLTTLQLNVVVEHKIGRSHNLCVRELKKLEYESMNIE